MNNGTKIPIVLVATKYDKVEEHEDKLEDLMTEDGLKQFALDNGFITGARISA